MRNPKLIAQHRGGQLTKDHHHKLIRWARECSQHVLTLIGDNVDERILHALQVAKEWEDDKVRTGEAMKASVRAHAVARELSDNVSIAVARSVGHAVATAHMADHSMGAALYALKAVKQAGGNVDDEREWQIKQLQSCLEEENPELVELVVMTMMEKEKWFKVL